MLGFFLFVGCKTIKKADRLVGGSFNSTYNILEGIKKNELNYKTYQSKGSIKVTTNGINVSANLKVQMIKDSAIWVNVSFFGITIYRAYATKDSIFVLDKRKREYIKEPFNKIEKILGLQLTIGQIQSIFHGSPILFSYNPKDYRLISDEFSTQLHYYYEEPKFEQSSIDQSLIWLNLNNLMAEKQLFHIKNKEKTLFIEYKNFETTPTLINVPKTIVINGFGKNMQDQLNIDFRQIKWDVAISTPFRIPPNYKRIVLE